MNAVPPVLPNRPTRSQTLAVAVALALGAAVSLGLARFSYALLLPPMRADLGWSYLTGGAMNTVNAIGYLLGALLTPMGLRRFDARHLLLAGSGASGVLLVVHGLLLSDAGLYPLRLLLGIASAATFVAGGLLAARLVGAAPAGAAAKDSVSAGLVLGIYYGGVGAGVVASALVVPPVVALPVSHAWQWAWIALGVLALMATAITARVTRGLDAPPLARASTTRFEWRRYLPGLASYLLFGLGYIGYVTFNVTLLREQHLGGGAIAAFCVVMGVGVMASSFLWAKLLQRYRGGEPMCLLNVLVAVATVLPVLSTHPIAVFVSGALFGAVVLSVVAATTALVRHNAPVSAWPSGIAAFTIVFAVGQIVGPSMVGWLADGPGGLRMGLAVSAGVLAVGAALAWMQKPVSTAS
jgi:predicted MFS family arabinose efflux permease